MWIVIGKSKKKKNPKLVTNHINIYKDVYTNYNTIFDTVLHVEKIQIVPKDV